MLQSEFEERVGFRVQPKEYNEIEKIYMLCDMDKDAFCKAWKSKNFYPILEEVMRNHQVEVDDYIGTINRYNERDKHLIEEKRKDADFFLMKAAQYEDSEFRQKAVELIGEKFVVLRKLELNLTLWEDDYKYIKGHIC